MATDLKIGAKCSASLKSPRFSFKAAHCTEAGGVQRQPPARCRTEGTALPAGGAMPPASGHGAGAQSPRTPSSAPAHPARAVLPRLGCAVGPRFQTPLEVLGPLVPLGQRSFDMLRGKRPPATAIRQLKLCLRENGSCLAPGDGKRN